MTYRCRERTTGASMPGLRSPRHIGRAVVAADPDVMDKSGCTLTVGDLARD